MPLRLVRSVLVAVALLPGEYLMAPVLSLVTAGQAYSAENGSKCPKFCLRSSDGCVTGFPNCTQTTDAPVFQAQQLRLRDELRRRAEEARRKLQEREGAVKEHPYF